MKIKIIVLLITCQSIALATQKETNKPFKYTIINKTESSVQIIQEFNGWCGLNIMDLTSGQKNDLNTPCIMTRISFAIDKKLLTCPLKEECISKDSCWQTNNPAQMDSAVWIIEQFKADRVPQLKNKQLGVLGQVVLPATPAGIAYVISRCSPESCLYDMEK